MNSSDVNPPPIPLSNQPKLPSPSALLKETWENYSRNWKTYIGIVLVPLILTLLTSFLLKRGTIVILIVLAILIFLLDYFAIFALLIAISESGASPSVSRSYQKALSLFFPFAWMNFIASFTIFGGAILLFVPGIILSIF
ncbi:MAG: hypothetical protein HY093_00455 [Candidatus Liptonbacteria bacterium]|nr:hypothetical protein [Candidatus Liptonbacteria bacterium]